MSHPSKQRNLMTFRLDRLAYALPIEPIAQIIDMVTITPIVQGEDSLAGVINVRGMAVPVVNLRRHFGLPEAPLALHTPIVLVHVDHCTVGLIVDEVRDVLSPAGNELIRVIDVLPEEIKVPIVQGLVHTPDGMALLLDVEQIFRPDQKQALAQVAQALVEGMEEPPTQPQSEVEDKV